MRALITGALGFVGKHLTNRLEARQGTQVYVLDVQHNPTGDVRHYESVRLLVERIQPTHVFHLAAQAYVAESGRNPTRTMDVNTLGTLNLLTALRDTGSDAKVLLAGTSEEYGYDRPADEKEVTEDSACLPTTVYGVSKLAATTLGQVFAHEHGMHVVCTRAFNHTGPGQQYRYAVPSFVRRVVRAERAGDIVRHGNLDAVRNWLDVRDVVRAYSLVIDAEPGIYNVCGSTNTAMGEVLDTLVELADGPNGRSIRTRPDDRLWRPTAHGPWVPPSFRKLHDATGWAPEIRMVNTLYDMLSEERKVQNG